MGVGWTSKLILAFVTLLIGVVLIGQVASEGNSRTNLDSAFEQINVMAANNGTGVNSSEVFGPLTVLGDTNVDCVLTAYTFENSSGTDLTETTDYVLDTDAGTFTLTNTSFSPLFEVTTGDNLTNISYSYCPVGYMTQGWGRTAIDLAPGFFAIALLLTSIGLFYSVYQDFKGM